MMLDSQELDELFMDRCRSVVESLLGKYGWRLLTPEELTQQIVASASPADLNTVTAVRTAALHLYSRELHRAVCIKSQNAIAQQRCNLAFEELSHYLYNIALYRWQSAELAQELAQDALARIWEQREKCEEPGAFLKFCLHRLLHASTYHLRAAAKDDSFDELFTDDNGEEMQAELVDTTMPPPDTAITCRDLWLQWLTRFREIYETRAQRQLDAVYCKYFLEMTEAEIMERLKTTLDNLQALRAKGVRRLKSDKQLRALTKQLLTNCR